VREFTRDSPLAARAVASPNFGQRQGGIRPSILLLHYTGMPSAGAALEWLTSPASQVSCHYLIDDEGVITQLVAEEHRAWHAGVSHWRGMTDINSCSIGIEIQNRGHEAGYPDFPGAQMAATERLCLDITRRHQIEPRQVLAHSDVAPRRKIDPGEKFDWARLARAGVGYWVAPLPIAAHALALARGGRGEAVKSLQQKLQTYGYGLAVSGKYDEETECTVKAFQRHFRPALIDGKCDMSTATTLDALLAGLPPL
jgi:N-acetylmuramoyl-L-alanine amidase